MPDDPWRYTKIFVGRWGLFIRHYSFAYRIKNMKRRSLLEFASGSGNDPIEYVKHRLNHLSMHFDHILVTRGNIGLALSKTKGSDKGKFQFPALVSMIESKA